MRPFRSPTFAALLLVAGPASASTWIVDDNGGPGVDFTTIAAAEAASVACDVILVRPGNYDGFELDVGVSILGDPGAFILSVVTIQNVPAGPRATLAGFSTRGIRIEGCIGPVILEELTVGAFYAAQLASTSSVVAILDSLDVRLRAVHVSTTVLSPYFQPIHGIQISGGRVELSQCWAAAGHGASCGGDIHLPGDGGDGVYAQDGASVRIGGSSTRGGDGGTNDDGWCSSDNQDGGAGLRILGASDVIVSGLPGNTIAGGQQAVGDYCEDDGEPGNGVIVASDSALRFSGATAIGQNYYPGCGGSVADIVGPYVQPPVPDPSLTFTGAAHPGGSITYTLHGEPGARARLSVGRQLVVVDVPNADEDRLLVPLRTYDLGFLPASGTASFTVNLGGALPRGMLLVAQGSVESPGGALALTHSLPTTLR